MINYDFLNTLTIIYIENNHDTKANFLEMVDGLFNKVIPVNNVNHCISILSEESIDIILSDISTPHVEGIKVLKKIREKDLNIPIILITDNKQEDKILEAIKYQVSDYLPKNINKKLLIKSIQEISRKKHYTAFIKDMEEDLEELVSAIDDVALISKSSLDGKITFVNKYFCETLGYSQEELLGKNHNFFRAMNLNEEKLNELDNAIKHGKVWEGKMKYISKSNEIFFCYLTMIPIFDSLDNSLKEYMYIRFLSTQEVIEQSEFKKKVVQNISSGRRINLEARAQIDILFEQLDSCKNIDFIKSSLIDEKKRLSKFSSQLSFYEEELKTKEAQIKVLSQKASVKIKAIIETEKNIRIKKDEAINTVSVLKEELDLRNKDVNNLNQELDTQIEFIEKLRAEIAENEKKLGLI